MSTSELAKVFSKIELKNGGENQGGYWLANLESVFRDANTLPYLLTPLLLLVIVMRREYTQ